MGTNLAKIYDIGTGSSPATTGTTTRTTTTTSTSSSSVQKSHISHLVESAAAYYEEMLCMIAPLPLIRCWADMLSGGINPDAISYAIDETALAPRPSAKYCLAICKRLLAQGITTREAASRRPDQAVPAHTVNHNPALRYQQRTTSEADYSGLFVDPEEELRKGGIPSV